MFGKILKQAGDAVKQAQAAVTGKAAAEEKKDEPAAAEPAAAAPAAAAPAPEKKEDPEDNAKWDRAAGEVREAIKGFGTDEDKLIKALGALSAGDAAKLRAAYERTQDGRDIVQDIKDDCGGAFEDALVMIVDAPEVHRARMIRASMKGVGTNEELLIESLFPLSDGEIAAAQTAYGGLFEKSIVDDLKSEIGGTLESFAVTVVESALKGRATPDEEQAAVDAEKLHAAGEDKIGTYEPVFVEIFGKNTPEYVQGGLTMAYSKAYGKALTAVLKSEFGGDKEHAFLAVATPRPVYLAEQLHKAMKGVGSDTSAIVRLVCGNREHLAEMNKHFLAKYEKSIARWVAAEEGGDLAKLLDVVIQAHV